MNRVIFILLFKDRRNLRSFDDENRKKRGTGCTNRNARNRRQYCVKEGRRTPTGADKKGGEITVLLSRVALGRHQGTWVSGLSLSPRTDESGSLRLNLCAPQCWCRQPPWETALGRPVRLHSWKLVPCSSLLCGK